MTEPVSGADGQDAGAAVDVQLRAIASDVFGLDESAVGPDLAFGSVDAWDSIGHINLMLEIESRFTVDIPPDAIGELLSLRRIRAWLEEQGR